jgi:hypothetical protein
VSSRAPIHVVDARGQGTEFVQRGVIQKFPIANGEAALAAIGLRAQLCKTEIGRLMGAGNDRSGTGVVDHAQLRRACAGKHLQGILAIHQSVEQHPILEHASLLADRRQGRLDGFAIEKHAQCRCACNAAADFDECVAAAQKMRLSGDDLHANLHRRFGPAGCQQTGHASDGKGGFQEGLCHDCSHCHCGCLHVEATVNPMFANRQAACRCLAMGSDAG